MAPPASHGRTTVHLHCGWPRTGTTSLQAILVEHREQLATAGIVYPERWRRNGGDAHNGLSKMLQPPSAADDPDASIASFQGYLRAHTGKTVLLSGESLSFWVFKGDVGPLAAMLEAAREVATVRCLWTMRRADDMFTSLFLHAVFGEHTSHSPERVFERALSRVDALMARMGGLGELCDEVTYVPYTSTGGHQAEILEWTGAPRDLRDRMVSKLSSRRPLNYRPTRKGAAVFTHREVFAERIGFPLTSRVLRQLLWSGELRFSDDLPCELLGGRRRRELHETALAAAREVGFAEYGDFFGLDSVPGDPVTPLGPEALTAADVARLAELVAAIDESGAPAPHDRWTINA